MRLLIDIGARGQVATTIETVAPLLVGLAAKLKQHAEIVQRGSLRDVNGVIVGDYFYSPSPGDSNA